MIRGRSRGIEGRGKSRKALRKKVQDNQERITEIIAILPPTFPQEILGDIGSVVSLDIDRLTFRLSIAAKSKRRISFDELLREELRRTHSSLLA